MDNFGPNKNNTRDNQDVLRIYIEALLKASSLDINESKLCLYYCMLTHKMEKLSVFPILTLFGQHSTGKSSIMKVMVQLVNNPNPDGEALSYLDFWQGLKINDTFPSLRDGLAYGTTSFIEEGDADRKKNEQLLADRYSRQTAAVKFKQEEKTGYSQSKAHIFGATIIHKRRGYKDPATASRSIFVTTKSEPDKIHHNTTFSDEGRIAFVEIACKVGIYKLNPNNRAQDLWYPLIGLAIELGDGEWITWAQNQLHKQTKSQTSGGSFDPQQAVILGLRSDVKNRHQTFHAASCPA